MGRRRDLGMDRQITRRDFVNGVAVPIGGALALPNLGRRKAAPAVRSAAPVVPQDPADYPPLRHGLRGSHAGSFEVGHQMRDQRGWDFSDAVDSGERYDLVVVGGGISGLAAAQMFVKNVGRQARVLILDNHDDFGGHAKRNEFHYNGRMMALNGGTLNIESYGRYNQPARRLLADIGIDVERFRADNADSRQMYRRMGLGSAYFFDAETWGEDRLVKRSGGPYGGLDADFLAKTPLSPKAQRDYLALYSADQPDHFPGLSSTEKKERLAKISYTDYMLEVVKVDPEVMWFFAGSGNGVFAVGADALPALYAWVMGQPGFDGLDLEPMPDGVLADLPGGIHGRQRESEEGAVHFPDGNATITRLLVRWLIPDAVPGKTQEDVGTARVAYDLLDREGETARVRLNSTVVRARHTGSSGNDGVEVSYVHEGRTYHVRGRHCVMACWNRVIPYLVPDMPEKQKEALGFALKGPLVYTSVAVRNWTAFEKLGVRSIATPTMYHDRVGLDEAVSLGDLRHAESPEEPIVLSLSRHLNYPGERRKRQHVMGREELLATPFETWEEKIRDQLGRVLGGGGFDPAEDIVAIAVNRWPHGYAYTYNTLYDPMEWAFTSTDERPCVIARQPFGSITIANSDAAASPHTDAAILEAHRAVQEVLQRRAMPAIGMPAGG